MTDEPYCIGVLVMKNYRIKKVEDENSTKYYPQDKRFGLFWCNMFGWEDYWDGGYYSFEEAQKAVCDYLKKPVVEYLSFDCGKTK